MVPGRISTRHVNPGLYIVKTNMNSRFCFSTCVHVNNPLQKIPQSGQPRVRCARMSKSLQTHSVLNGFRYVILRKHMKTLDFSIANFKIAFRAHAGSLKNHGFLVIWESGSYGNPGFTLQTPIWTQEFAFPLVSMFIIHRKKIPPSG